MRLLVIGGTIFLGRHLVEAALGRGHHVTLFNRGRHNPDLFPQAEKIRGDRASDTDLDAAFAGGRFDAVVDTCGYFPRIVGMSAERLADKADLYCFVSSVSVYSDTATPNQDEDAPVGTLEAPTIEQITGETYGPLKALCEQAVEAAFPRRALIIRPGLIVGPDDLSDRFAYWPHRLARGGGDVLAPGNGSQPVQIIDVRDLAEWMVRLLENRTTGVYNAVGPDTPLTLRDVIETSREAAGTRANLVWVPDPFLREMSVGQWVELPLWLDASEGMDGFSAISAKRALAAGLTFRPLAETVRDTLAWDAGRPQEEAWKATLTPEKERRVLEAWAEARK